MERVPELDAVQYVAHRAGGQAFGEPAHTGDRRVEAVVAFDLADSFTESHTAPATPGRRAVLPRIRAPREP
ncbi:hypothetical protein GCM10007079_23460 [Nocardiopsis terrae]|nr:hypothetical protein GCM10007079_23460 [Nocardiopsis terrae]